MNIDTDKIRYVKRGKDWKKYDNLQDWLEDGSLFGAVFRSPFMKSIYLITAGGLQAHGENNMIIGLFSDPLSIGFLSEHSFINPQEFASEDCFKALLNDAALREQIIIGSSVRLRESDPNNFTTYTILDILNDDCNSVTMGNELGEKINYGDLEKYKNSPAGPKLKDFWLVSKNFVKTQTFED